MSWEGPGSSRKGRIQEVGFLSGLDTPICVRIGHGLTPNFLFIFVGVHTPLSIELLCDHEFFLATLKCPKPCYIRQRGLDRERIGINDLGVD
jgi:hypothetical protein